MPWFEISNQSTFKEAIENILSALTATLPSMSGIAI
jgi:hypothetical protein